MRINMPIELPDEAIDEIVKKAQKDVLIEILKYITERESDFKKMGTNESKDILFGLRISKKKIEQYLEQCL